MRNDEARSISVVGSTSKARGRLVDVNDGRELLVSVGEFAEGEEVTLDSPGMTSMGITKRDGNRVMVV